MSASPGSTLTLATLLREHEESLLQQWARAVLDDPAIPAASRFDAPMLRDQMPELIEYLVAAIARHVGHDATIEPDGVGVIARRNAQARVSQHYSLAETLRELSHLRSVILDRCSREHVALEGEEARLLHALLDEAVSVEAIEMERSARAEQEVDRQRLRKTLELLSVGVVVVDANGGVIEANGAAEAVWGRPLRAIRGFADYASFRGYSPTSGARIPPEDWGMVGALVRGEPCYDLELEILSFDGVRKTILLSIVPIRDVGGTIVGAVKTIVDVTQRVRDARAHRIIAAATEALGESFDYETALKAVARLTVPHLATAFILDVVEENGRVRRLDAVHADPQMEPVLQRLRQYAPIPELDRPLSTVLRTGQPLLRRDVSEAWIRSTVLNADHLDAMHTLAPLSAMVVPMRARGKTFGLMTFLWADEGRRYDERDLGIAEDLAGHAAFAIDNARLYGKASQAIRERDTPIAELNAFLATAPVGFALIDHNLRFVRVNEALAAIDCVPMGEHLGRTVGEVLPLHRHIVEPVIARVFATGERILETELTVVSPERGELQILLSCTPVRPGTGETYAVGVVVTDVTAQRFAADQLRRDAEFRERFIAVLGHDLRNPLQSIACAAAIVLASEGVPEAVKSNVLRITRNGQRIERMIRDVLDLTRSRSGGGIPMHLREADLNAICEQAVDEIQIAHPARTIVLRHDDDGHGTWDPDRLMQVVSNLVSNAVAYSPADTPIEVEVRGEGADTVLVEVSNLGPPIPPEAIPSLFDPFRKGAKAAASGTRSEGLGLGLFIAQQIVKAHGGSVRVASDAEHGTRFAVSLPREPPRS